MRNVNKLGMMLCLAVVIVSCGSKNEGYTLSGNIEGTQATEAYLQVDKQVDTVTVQNGVFVFEGVLEEPLMSTLTIDGRRLNLLIENSEMTLSGSIENISDATFEGSASHLPFEEFLAKVVKYKDSKEAHLNYCKDFIKAHPDAFFTPNLIKGIYRSFDANEVKAMLETLSPEVRAGSVASSLSESVEKDLRVAIGAIAPDFVLNTAKDEEIKLSAIYAKNKYVLIDFWASWCIPCRKENPHVLAAYEAYSAKGFEVLGVSLDQMKEDWIKALEEDGLAWVNVWNSGGSVAKEYNVKGIPSNFLVDSSGKIVAKNLRGEALNAKLSELLQ